MKKNNSSRNKSLKRQLVSGTVYIALAAVVVAVTINTTVGIISDKTKIPESDPIDLNLPEIPKIPELSIVEKDILDSVTVPDTNQVSDIQEGIDSTVIEDIVPAPIVNVSDFSDNATQPNVDSYGIPVDADLGINKFLKPCNGFVSKSHSVDVPVYSHTMSDYRTHTGIDIVCDLGTEILCVNGGIVTDIYNDDLYGMTVKTTNREGYTVCYSNLMPTVSAGVEVGAILKTGEPVGGVGETAICEIVETPHVHLEIYGPDGAPLDPEELISF